MASVLLVDDDESNLTTLSALLELEGHAVTNASSSGEARRLLEVPLEVDVVVLDQHLRDGHGSDLVPLVRASLPRARILLMSGSLRTDEKFPDTVDACFVKGEDFGALLSTVESLLAH